MQSNKEVSVSFIRVFIGLMLILVFEIGIYAQTNYDLTQQYESLCQEIYETTKLYELQGKWDDAINLLKIGIDISQEKKGSKRSEAMLKSQLGNIYRLQRKFNNALTILNDAKALAESVDDQKIIGDCLFYIGYTYDYKELFNNDGDYDIARDYYEKSLVIRESIRDERGVGFSIFQIISNRSAALKKSE